LINICMATYIVYKSMNKVNGKYYIGKHKLVGDNFDYYFGSGPAVQAAVLKYGVESFERITLFETSDELECYNKEEELLGNLWLIDKNCYNKQPGGKGFSSGDQHYTQGNGFTEVHISNLRAARRRRPPHSEETKKKMSESRTGLKRSSETRKKMSQAQSGKNNPMYGKKHTNEKKKEISSKLKGKYTREKSSLFKGYYITPFGEFPTIKDACSSITIISRATIREWCLNSDKTVTKNMIGNSKYLQEADLGKTFKDLGFYFKHI
jgi:group I intron endonuclease